MEKRKKLSLPGSGKYADFLLDGMRAEDTANVDASGKTLIALGSPFASVIAHEIARHNPERIILTGGHSPEFRHFIEGRGIHFLERANWKALGITSRAYEPMLEESEPVSEKISRHLSMMPHAKIAWTEKYSQSTYENLLAVLRSGLRPDRVVLLVHELSALRAILTARHLLRNSQIEAITFRLPAHNNLYQSVMAKSEFYNLARYGMKWDYIKGVMSDYWAPQDPETNAAIDFLTSAEYHFADDSRRIAFDKFSGGAMFDGKDFAGDFLASVDALAPALKFADKKWLLDKKQWDPEQKYDGEYARLYAAMAILSGGFELDAKTRERLEIFQNKRQH
ncbi:MAG: hypothetical protein LBL46_01230 [Rickettsiales bacterium]|jgi:hypothetical protein|nr:hypothetical protein [Rickettsiales bacterium]